VVPNHGLIQFSPQEPVLLIALSLVLAIGFGELADRLARPRRALLAGSGAALTIRAAVIAWVWLLTFGLTGRPLFAAAATVALIGAGVAISNAKQRYLQEPLLFSDIALLEHVPGHLSLFYVERRWQALAFAVLAGAVAWLVIEPRSAANAQIGSLMIAFAAVIAVWGGVMLAPVARLIGEPSPQDDVARLGLIVTMLAYFAGWRLQPALPAPAPALLHSAQAFDAVIVVQAESFVDLRRLGPTAMRLPAFDRLKRRAVSTGLIEVPCIGGYTLRPESAVLTGRSFLDQGFDRFHPYARPERFAAGALPNLFRSAGWDTLFVHPYDRTFFRRGRAMPALGFQRFADQSAFATAQRVGPHVSDDAVAEFLLAEIRASAERSRRLFAYAVTMEAHDPYGPGRIPGEPDPLQQYVHHIENADRALGKLADRLDGEDWRVLLVLFGDHVPVLPQFADPFPDTRTDYLVVELGKKAKSEPIGLSVTRPEHLHALICAAG
jgi:phosphoglycerol transferase MdoB-like AlkP superfamily enzyme